jgi:hypothetical protein
MRGFLVKKITVSLMARGHVGANSVHPKTSDRDGHEV